MTTKTKTKTTSKKKTPAKKTASKKPTPAKKVALSPTSHIRVVAGSAEPKRPERRAIKKAIPAEGITAKDLCERAKCRISTLAAMVRRGFIEERA